MKVVAVVGARPQFIKAAAVSRVLRGESGVTEVLVHTGQHHDSNMSDVFFEQMAIPRPDYHLGIAGGGHGVMTGRMLHALEGLMEQERPDWVLVYGDTNSTLAGALAAAKLHLPVAHVEAGLRSFNRVMPEEINRVLTDHCSDLLFTPTDRATRNLRNEGVPEDRIAQVGDVMFDAALFYRERAERHSRVLAEHGLKRGGYVLATIHRQENTDDPIRLRVIFEALQIVNRNLPVVLPLHPRTKQCLSKTGLDGLTVGLHLLSPASYLDMVMLERGAAVIATDSGGVQKEAYFHGIPCVTLRDETEWVELVDLGWNRLAPPRRANISATILSAEAPTVPQSRSYGDGAAAQRIADCLLP